MSLRQAAMPLLIAGLSWAPPALAQGTVTTEPAPSFFSELVSIVLPLAFIILGLFLVLHLARRRYGLRGGGAALTVVQVLPLGPRERLVLVRTHGGRVLAVGVSSQAVHLVTELDPGDLPPDPAPEAGAPTPKLLGIPLNLRDFREDAKKRDGHH